MFTHEEASNLLDSTMAILEGELTTTPPEGSEDVIDQWLEQLHQLHNGQDIAQTLEQVKAQLTTNQVKPEALSQLLQTLATQTAEFSTRVGSEGDMAPRLEGLAAALNELAGQIHHLHR